MSELKKENNSHDLQTKSYLTCARPFVFDIKKVMLHRTVLKPFIQRHFQHKFTYTFITATVQLSMHSCSFFLPAQRTMFSQNHCVLSHRTIQETIGSGRRTVHRFPITIISSRKEIDRATIRASDPLFTSPVRYRMGDRG